MKIVIYYSTITGNTGKMAFYVSDFLRKSGYDVALIQNTHDLIPVDADYHIIAFWCRRSGMDDLSKRLLTGLKGEKILAIGTIGGDAAGPYGRRVEDNVRKMISQENLCLGVKVCQGAIDLDRIRHRMSLPKEDRRHADQAKYEKALKTQGHPDHEDLKEIEVFCNAIFT